VGPARARADAAQVRADDESVVQFQYGDDGLDALNLPFLSGSGETFKFLRANAPGVLARLGGGEAAGGEGWGRAHKAPAGLQAGAQVEARRAVDARSGEGAEDGQDGAWMKGFRRGAFAAAAAAADGLPARPAATVLKVREGGARVDLRYEADGFVAKKVPVLAARDVVDKGLNVRRDRRLLPSPLTPGTPPVRPAALGGGRR
jgi:hypothetical protein